MVKPDWLVEYYNEWLADEMFHNNRRHAKLLLDYLLENGLLIDQVKVVVTGYHCQAHYNMLVKGVCYDEDANVFSFTAYYVQNPRWQNPVELNDILDKVELEI